MSVVEFLKRKIQTDGPMDIGAYMSFVLGHPEFGYYMTRDPLGKSGDFTTAPEVSQMFGEVLGAYVVHQWIKMGRSARFTLLECGPGRGTLMADMLRAGSVFPEFLQAVSVHLLETSPVLKMKQRHALGAANPVWHDDLSTVPDDAPLLVVANEFLDALPVRQFVRGLTNNQEKAWMERCVAYSDGEGFHYVTPVIPALGDQALVDEARFKAGVGEIVEVSPARAGFVQDLCALLKKTGGGALFIDYGHSKSAPGDTLQAIKGHEYCDVLEHIGDADLTAHVDFQALREVAERAGAEVSGPMEQGDFLKTMGIVERTEALKAAASEAQGLELDRELKRLSHKDEMGALFKVLGVSFSDLPSPSPSSPKS